ncbi:MAG: DNA topoisomerase IV subunit B [Alphaproteobacteria bacterium]
MNNDLFANAAVDVDGYSAKDIEVLEGLEPVRRRPGMYIGGTDERALHHLVSELLDNAMDEAVAGHASFIAIELEADGGVSVRDNGRGIPVDPHPRFPKKSALEVIMTTLHSGGKFGGNAYTTSGGLHGVGLSVVNALAESLEIEVARDRRLWRQRYAKGTPLGPLEDAGPMTNRRGTLVRFLADREIFGDHRMRPQRLYEMARSKAYLHRGVEIRWQCEPSLLRDGDNCPAEARLHFPGGLSDFLATTLDGRAQVTPQPFLGKAELAEGQGRLEWAIAWPLDQEPGLRTYCNTVPTPMGGSHEQGLRTALTKGLRGYAELVGSRKAATQITTEDVVDGAYALLSLFIREPQFQGQTKDRLSMPAATRLVEAALKDHFDHWVAQDPAAGAALLAHVLARAEERLARRQAKDLQRKTATSRKLRLPGKLADCARSAAAGTELFLVEGDSAGGSAKQARNRETQAVLPLRGKILNVASATLDKLQQNQELADLMQAVGCGRRDQYREENLRYERIIIMTDADVDGAHIASLLMTFFYREMPQLIANGHLFLAMPPLFRLARGGEVHYARDDEHRNQLLRDVFKGLGKVEISRFKGLGEMPAKQLKETTMDPKTRGLLRVMLADGDRAARQGGTAGLVESLMGRKPELRLAFIQDHANEAENLDV